MRRRNKFPIAVTLYFLAVLAYFGSFWLSAFTYDDFNNLIARDSNMWGDWSAHFTMGSAMAFRSLFLSESPLLIHAPFHYPYFVNWLSAVLVRAGLPFVTAFTLPSFVMTMVFAAALFYFYRALFRSDRTAALGAMFFFFQGGVGFIHLIAEALATNDVWHGLLFPGHFATQMDSIGIRYVSVIYSMLIPQRGFPLGMAMGLFCLAYLWNRRTPHRCAIAGLVYGFLFFVHSHSFLAISIVFLLWGIADVVWSREGTWKRRLTLWAFVAEVGILTALPFMWIMGMFSHGFAPAIKWLPGWYASEDDINWIVFWFRNWMFLPVIGLAGLYFWIRNQSSREEQRRTAFFVAPFLVLFALANLFLFQPWIWDNTKIFVWVSVAMCGLAAYAIVQWWSGPIVQKIAVVVLTFILCCSGAIDAYRVMVRSLNGGLMYSAEEIALAEWVKEKTSPDSLWLTGDDHHNLLFNLTGRRVLMAYGGWLWTHGYEYDDIENDVGAMLTHPENRALFDSYGIQYVLLGSVEERDWFAKWEDFDAQFPVLKKTENYTIYAVTKDAKKFAEEPVVEDGVYLTPEKALDKENALMRGIVQRIYPNMYFSGPPVEQATRPTFNFYRDGNQDHPYDSPYSMEVDGYLRVPDKGLYTLSLESDDGSWLYVDGKLVIDNGGTHGMDTKQHDVLLFKGFHRFKVRYFNQQGGEGLELRWGKAGEPLRFVEDRDLFYDPSLEKNSAGTGSSLLVGGIQ